MELNKIWDVDIFYHNNYIIYKIKQSICLSKLKGIKYEKSWLFISSLSVAEDSGSWINI